MHDLNERSVGTAFVQMLSGIYHIHMARVLHRDITVDNFIVGGEDGGTIKLCDFGLSANLPLKGKKRGLSGTSPYMCPEMIKDEFYDLKADIWSFGVVVYLLLFGGFPYIAKYDDSVSMRKAIVKGTPPKFRPVDEEAVCHSDFVVAFVKTLLIRDPDVRPSATDALRMPYMEMIQNGCFMCDVDLPSLQPILSLSTEAVTVEFLDQSQKLPVDSWLIEACATKSCGVSPRRCVDAWLNTLQLQLGGDEIPDSQLQQTRESGIMKLGVITSVSSEASTSLETSEGSSKDHTCVTPFLSGSSVIVNRDAPSKISL
jgi:serine/threonine protein kinase